MAADKHAAITAKLKALSESATHPDIRRLCVILLDAADRGSAQADPAPAPPTEAPKPRKPKIGK
jgi:hypothetical protein